MAKSTSNARGRRAANGRRFAIIFFALISAYLLIGEYRYLSDNARLLNQVFRERVAGLSGEAAPDRRHQQALRGDLRAARSAYLTTVVTRVEFRGYGFELTRADLFLASPVSLALLLLFISPLMGGTYAASLADHFGRSADKSKIWSLVRLIAIPLPALVLAFLVKRRRYFVALVAALFGLDLVCRSIAISLLRVGISDPLYPLIAELVNLVAVSVVICVTLYSFDLNGFAFPDKVSAPRRFLLSAVFAGVIVASGRMASPVGASLLARAATGHAYRPRYRRSKAKDGDGIFLKHGFYRNRRSGKIFFVNAEGRIAGGAGLQEKHLEWVGLTPSLDFTKLMPQAAKHGFVEMALSAIEQDQYGAAIEILGVGARYEIWKAQQSATHKVNRTALKLYIGLCQRYRVTKRIAQFRKELIADHLLDRFHEKDETWIYARGAFKQRWRYRREHYAGVQLKPWDRAGHLK